MEKRNVAGMVRKYLLVYVVLFACIVTVPANSPAEEGAEEKDSIQVEELAQKFKSFSDDFDEMAKRRYVRVLVPYSKTFFFFDGAEPKGLTYEAVTGFGKYINQRYKAKNLEIKMVVIPTPRDQLFSRLNQGLGDIAVGNLTITEQRVKQVDFSEPFMTKVSEIVVTGKDVPQIKSAMELAGRTIHVRKSSSYYESLNTLNTLLASAGKERIEIVAADEHLEDEDLLEMVNANLIPAIVIDDHKGNFWEKILPDIQLHHGAAVASMGRIGWAVRKGSPKLLAEINGYRDTVKKGTLTGNVIFNKYLKDQKYIENAGSGENMRRFNAVVEYFKKYGDQYDFDYLMLTAQGYQESKLNQNLKSKAGAVGVMQVLPSTAKDKNVGIPDIHKTEPNIHAGTKYMRFVADRYFPEEEGIDQMNRTLFCFASYNAGPAKIAQVRKEAAKQGLDPNVWFNNVELVAARMIGREPVQYVSNIFKYYIAYKMLQEQQLQKQ